jgi:hypothetical protein
MRFLKCINDKYTYDSPYGPPLYSGITENRIYKILDEDNIGYKITDNNYKNYWYTKNYFVDVTRELKLNRLLDNHF